MAPLRDRHDRVERIRRRAARNSADSLRVVPACSRRQRRVGASISTTSPGEHPKSAAALFQRHPVLTVMSDLYHVIAELVRIRLGHSDTPTAGHSASHLSCHLSIRQPRPRPRDTSPIRIRTARTHVHRCLPKVLCANAFHALGLGTSGPPFTPNDVLVPGIIESHGPRNSRSFGKRRSGRHFSIVSRTNSIAHQRFLCQSWTR